MRFLIRTVLVALSLFVLNACGGGGGDSAGSDNSSASTSGASNGANSSAGDSGNNGTTSDTGNTGTDTNTTNTPPTAHATVSPTTATEGDAVTFDGSGSSDSDGTINAYRWHEGNVTLSTQQSFTTSSLTVGTHTITLTVTDDLNATGSDIVTVTIQSAAAITQKLKKTGQTKSYDENGNEVTDGSVKDDGYYQTGVTPSYTRDDTKEIVTDNITGLMWQDNADASSITKNWGDAKSYCQNLSLGGYSDWRLPSIEELEGIVDFGHSDPAIDPIFQHVASSYYWSSTTHVYYAGYAWGVYFWVGNSLNHLKSDTYYARCVRGGQ